MGPFDDLLTDTSTPGFAYNSNALLDEQTRLMEEERKKRQALEEAKDALAAYQSRPMPAGEGIGTALLQLAPILIGAAANGREGAYQGALAGLAGTKSYGDNLALRDKQEQELNLLNYKQALDDENKVQSAIDLAGLTNAKQESDYAGKMNLLTLRNNLSGTSVNGGMTPEEAADLGVKPGSGAYVKAQLHKQDQERQDNKTDDEKLRDETKAEMEKTRLDMQATEGERRATGEVFRYSQVKRLGLAFPDPPTDKQVDKALVTRGAFLEINDIQNKLIELYRKQGWSALGEAAQKREIANALGVMNFKNLQAMGANFTIMEKKLTTDALQSPETLADFLWNAATGKDVARGVEMSQALNQEAYVRRLLESGAIDTQHPDAYARIQDSPTQNTLRAMGIQFKDGQISAPNAVDDLIASAKERADHLKSLREKLGTSGKREVSDQSFEPQQGLAPAKETAGGSGGKVSRYVDVNGRKWDALLGKWAD